MSAAPPIGLVPKMIRDQQRAAEIVAAMDRFVQASKKIPRSWLEELAAIYTENEA